MAEIRIATEADLSGIMRWLKAEEEETGEGFYCNRQMIHEGFDDGDLYALVDDGYDEPVAFVLNGNICPYIVEVRPDCRGRGYGRAISEFMIEYWRQKDVPVIEIECAPSTSADFWKTMGFDIYTTNRARLFLSKTYDLPLDLPETQVKIAFFPERVKWEGDVEPYQITTVQACRISDRSIKLSERIFLFTGDGFNYCLEGDPVISIEVDGAELYKDKARYRAAASIGVKPDPYGYYVDEINIID